MNKLIVKSNSLIEAKYKLTAREQKIILYLISQIKKDDEEFKTYTFPIQKFINMMRMKNPNYNEILDIIEALQKKVLRLKTEKGVASVVWLSFVFHNERAGTIDMRFDPFLKPFLLQLKDRFTSYEIRNIIGLKRSYSIRLYELLKQYENLKERIIGVLELRELLGIEGKYSAFGNIKQKILEPSRKEIQKKTDICFDFVEIKAGRKVEKVKFIIYKKIASVDSTKLSECELSLNSYPLYDQINKITTKRGYSVDVKTVQRWEKLSLKKWRTNSEKKLLFLVDEVNYNKEIASPIGYITSILQFKNEKEQKKGHTELIRNDINNEKTISEEERKKFETLISKYKNDCNYI